jgi:2'-5' RNA ligase
MGEQFSFRFETQSPNCPLYFALRPSAGAAQIMAETAARCCMLHGLSERPYDKGRLHLSLHTVVSRRGPRKGDLEAALRAAERVRAAPFPVAFDRVDTFQVRRDKRPTVLCCGDGGNRLAALRDLMREALAREGLWRGPARFEPHLTLVWDWKCVPPSRLDQPIGWMVEDFVLLQTIFGEGRQVERGRWPLRT